MMTPPLQWQRMRSRNKSGREPRNPQFEHTLVITIIRISSLCFRMMISPSLSEDDDPSSPMAKNAQQKQIGKRAKKSTIRTYPRYHDNSDIIVMLSYDDLALPLNHPDQARIFRAT